MQNFDINMTHKNFLFQFLSRTRRPRACPWSNKGWGLRCGMFAPEGRTTRYHGFSRGAPYAILALVRRFPLVIAASVLFTVSGILIMGDNSFRALSPETYGFFQNVFFTATLGLPLITVFTLVSEQYKNTLRRAAWQGAGLAILVLYFFTRPDAPIKTIDEMAQNFFFTFSAYLLLFVPAVLRRFKPDEVWAFGKMLVSRFLITFLYGAILFIGLILALSAIKFLFDLPFQLIYWFYRIWIMVVGIFGVWYFLAGLPRDKEIETSHYPARLKTLFHGIFLPLIILYWIILCAYAGKALFIWNWPKDGAAQWILGYIGFGIMCLIIARPLLNNCKWLRRFFFFASLLSLPFFVVLFLGIGVRISAYGFTTNRLIVVLAGIWTLAVIVYFLITRLKGRIVYIPLSLATLCVIASMGPWSIFNIAVKDQLSRLESLLMANGLLVNGKPVKGPPVFISEKDQKEARSIIDYLFSYHRMEKRREWIDQIVTERGGNMSGWKIREYFGLHWRF